MEVPQRQSFDSILVRLKDDTLVIQSVNAEFRFHTGSIKRFPLVLTILFLWCVSIPYWFD